MAFDFVFHVDRDNCDDLYSDVKSLILATGQSPFEMGMYLIVGEVTKDQVRYGFTISEWKALNDSIKESVNEFLDSRFPQRSSQ